MLSEQELFKCYENCHILINPSTYESFGLSIVEAMSHSMTVIATNVGGVKDNIDNGVNGILIDYVSNDQIIHAIENEIKKLMVERNKLSSISKKAQKSIQQNFK